MPEHLRLMKPSCRSVEDLVLWQEAMSLCQAVYLSLKDCKDPGLREGMQRSSVAVPASIAEGFDLNTHRGFLRHLRRARGSCCELRTLIQVARAQGCFNQPAYLELLSRAKRLGARIQRFIEAREILEQLELPGLSA